MSASGSVVSRSESHSALLSRGQSFMTKTRKCSCEGCGKFNVEEWRKKKKEMKFDPREREAMIGKVKEEETAMEDAMLQDAVNAAAQALDRNDREDEIARHVKNCFDRKYSPTWHCIVGRGFGCEVTYEAKHYCNFYMGKYYFVLFKCG